MQHNRNLRSFRTLNTAVKTSVSVPMSEPMEQRLMMSAGAIKSIDTAGPDADMLIVGNTTYVVSSKGSGAVPIDNNISEREMKRIVLNRKASLFVGNERGGETAAILASLTSTCRRHDIDPQRYLTQLLTNLADTPMSQLDQWIPDQWKAANPEPMPTVKV